MKSKALKLLFLVAAGVVMTGCGTQPNLYTSVAVVKQNDTERNRVIIDDLLGFIQSYYAPAQTTFVITPESSSENLRFAEQFENRFKNAGFAISRESVSGGVPFAWKIDRVGQLVRATYYIDDAVVTRVYRHAAAGWMPVGPFSAHNLGYPRFVATPAAKPNRTSKKPKRQVHHKKHKPKTPAQPASHAPKGIYGKVTAHDLSIRKLPERDAEVIGNLKYGQNVSVAYKLKNDNGEFWTKLKDPDGYVSSKYLKIIGGKHE